MLTIKLLKGDMVWARKPESNLIFTGWSICIPHAVIKISLLRSNANQKHTDGATFLKILYVKIILVLTVFPPEIVRDNVTSPFSDSINS